MANLILVRHTESELNKLGVWTGLTNIPLSEKGIEEARAVGQKLKSFPIDLAYTSVLLRAKQTLDEIKTILKLDIPTFESAALNERDYGIYTGKNKWEIQKEIGQDKFKKLRRGWDVPIQNGESLKDVYNRTVPYYTAEIFPKLKSGKNVLIIAHGNSLRALVKYLENLSGNEVENLEIATGEIYTYKIDINANIVSKTII